MEDATWEQIHQTVTHILTFQTNNPPLQSQLFVSSQIPCYLNWDYPPFICRPKANSPKTFPSLHLKWGISLFLKRVSRLGFPETSWRSKCPYQQPPPLILAEGLEEARWGDEQRREYVRNRLRRKRLGTDVNPLIPFLLPNILLLGLLVWDPFPEIHESGNSQSIFGSEKSISRDRMFILGMGYIGAVFARQLVQNGWGVTGTCKSVTKKKILEEDGFDAWCFDGNEPDPRMLDDVRHYTHLLVSVPPVVGIGDPILQHEELLRRALKDGDLEWIGYLSSTSVYGNWDGEWVDEECTPRPALEPAKLRLAAEKGWLKLGLELGLSAQVFRLGGIYGPGRSAVDTILREKRLSEDQKRRESKKYTSRIHVADICQALMASIRTPSSGRIYNVVDDDPAPRQEVFAFAQELVEKRWPGQIKGCTTSEWEEPSIPDVSLKGDKRVSNARMKELGVKLHYPSYRSGLKSIIDHISNRF